MLILYLGAIIVGLLIYVVMRCRINKKRAGNTAALCMKNPPHYHIVQQVPQPKNSTLVYLKGEGHTGEKSAPYLVGLLLIRHNFELSGLTCRKINYMWQKCHCPAFRSLLATTINDNKFSWMFMVVFWFTKTAFFYLYMPTSWPLQSGLWKPDFTVCLRNTRLLWRTLMPYTSMSAALHVALWRLFDHPKNFLFLIYQLKVIWLLFLVTAETNYRDVPSSIRKNIQRNLCSDGSWLKLANNLGRWR